MRKSSIWLASWTFSSLWQIWQIKKWCCVASRVRSQEALKLSPGCLRTHSQEASCVCIVSLPSPRLHSERPNESCREAVCGRRVALRCLYWSRYQTSERKPSDDSTLNHHLTGSLSPEWQFYLGTFPCCASFDQIFEGKNISDFCDSTYLSPLILHIQERHSINAEYGITVVMSENLLFIWR